MENASLHLFKDFKRYSAWNGKKISDNVLQSYLQIYDIKRYIENIKNLQNLPRETILTYLIFIIRIEIYIKSLIVKDRIIYNSIESLFSFTEQRGSHPQVEELEGGMNWKSILLGLTIMLVQTSGTSDNQLTTNDFKSIVTPLEERQLALGESSRSRLEELLSKKQSQIIQFIPNPKKEYNIEDVYQVFVSQIDSVNDILNDATKTLRRECKNHAARLSELGVNPVSGRMEAAKKLVAQKVENAVAVKKSEVVGQAAAYGIQAAVNVVGELGKAAYGVPAAEKNVSPTQLKEFTDQALMSLDKDYVLEVSKSMTDLETKFLLQSLCSFTPEPFYGVSMVDDKIKIDINFSNPNLLDLVLAQDVLIKELETTMEKEKDAARLGILRNLMEQMKISQRVLSSGDLFSGIYDPVMANFLNMDQKLSGVVADAKYNAETFSNLVLRMLEVLPITNEEAQATAAIAKDLFKRKQIERKQFADELRAVSNVVGDVFKNAVGDLANGAAEAGGEILDAAGELAKKGVKNVGDVGEEAAKGFGRIGDALLDGPLLKLLLVAFAGLGMYGLFLIMNCIYAGQKATLLGPRRTRKIRSPSPSLSPTPTPSSSSNTFCEKGGKKIKKIKKIRKSKTKKNRKNKTKK